MAENQNPIRFKAAENFNQVFRRLKSEVDSNGNRPYLRVTSHPFPIFEATRARMDLELATLPEKDQTPLLKFTAKIASGVDGITREIGVGLADAYLDAFGLFPINVAFPKLRHLFYKNTIYQLQKPDSTWGSVQDSLDMYFSPSGQVQMRTPQTRVK